MTIFYKLTDERGRTGLNTYPVNVTQWGPGVTHSAQPGDGALCSPLWIHLYADPLIAVLMNPRHANFENPLLWECEIDGDTKDDMGLKCGAKTVTTLRTIPLPVMALTQRIATAILLAAATLEMTGKAIPEWSMWADNWLSGHDRDLRAAKAAALAAEAAGVAAGAARAAADAAGSGARVARVTWVAEAAEAARAAARTSDAEFTALLLTCLYAAMDME